MKLMDAYDTLNQAAIDALTQYGVQRVAAGDTPEEVCTKLMAYRDDLAEWRDDAMERICSRVEAAISTSTRH